MIYKILQYPNKILTTKCEPVQNFDKKLKKIVSNMFETMVAAGGIGLSANQIGISRQIVVTNIAGKQMVFINPKIINHWNLITFTEGCLSLVGETRDKLRFNTIEVAYNDEEGNEKNLIANGLLAICLQHEIDHLNGVDFSSNFQTAQV